MVQQAPITLNIRILRENWAVAKVNISLTQARMLLLLGTSDAWYNWRSTSLPTDVRFPRPAPIAGGRAASASRVPTLKTPEEQKLFLRINCTRMNISRIFKQKTGMGPSEYKAGLQE